MRLMNRAVVSIIVLALLILTIFSPFAALGTLMLVLLAAAFVSAFWNVVQAAAGNSKQPSKN
ncbi:hypothetical protein H6F79_13810 [Trichocoleus sp. FACHB-69]|nr:hypothetical protein [Trichocoleus sp. FACHB-69]